jgi:hypothetical protein
MQVNYGVASLKHVIRFRALKVRKDDGIVRGLAVAQARRGAFHSFDADQTTRARAQSEICNLPCGVCCRRRADISKQVVKSVKDRKWSEELLVVVCIFSRRLRYNGDRHVKRLSGGKKV